MRRLRALRRLFSRENNNCESRSRMPLACSYMYAVRSFRADPPGDVSTNGPANSVAER